MSFQRFIEERGPSYRHCDVFDDLYADIQWQLKQELEKQSESNHHHSLDLTSSLAMIHLKSIAEKLYKYEFPQTNFSVPISQNVSVSSISTAQLQQRKSEIVYGPLNSPSRSLSKIKLPTLDAYKRIHSETFPYLDCNVIERLLVASSNQNVMSGSEALSQESSCNISRPKNNLSRPHLVPYGPPIETVRNMTVINKALVDLTDSNSIKGQISFSEVKPIIGQEPNWETSCIRKLDAISQVK